MGSGSARLWVTDGTGNGAGATERSAGMLVLAFSVQAVTHTRRLHRYLPSKGIGSRPRDAEDARRLRCGDAAASSSGSSSSGGETTTSGISGPAPAPWVHARCLLEKRKEAGLLCWALRNEGSGGGPLLEEEEGRSWLSRTETLDSCLWGRLETEEDAPGLWRERREEDRLSPNRGDKGKKRGREGRRNKGVRDGAERRNT